jgi:hypothetical protein
LLALDPGHFAVPERLTPDFTQPINPPGAMWPVGQQSEVFTRNTNCGDSHRWQIASNEARKTFGLLRLLL